MGFTLRRTKLLYGGDGWIWAVLAAKHIRLPVGVGNEECDSKGFGDNDQRAEHERGNLLGAVVLVDLLYGAFRHTIKRYGRAWGIDDDGLLGYGLLENGIGQGVGSDIRNGFHARERETFHKMTENDGS